MRHGMTALALGIICAPLWAQSPPMPELYGYLEGPSPLADAESPLVCFETPEGAAVVIPPTDPEAVRRQVAAAWDSPTLQYVARDRWTRTATNPTVTLDEPFVITYSFVPDGTLMPPSSFTVDPNPLPSTLFAVFNDRYSGGQAEWQPLFDEAFSEWADETPITYVYEPNDDGAPVGFSAPGELGVRGDVRIGARAINGSGGTAAFNYYPDTGDMVLDDAESLWGRSGSAQVIENLISHEHGHGLGFDHSGPVGSAQGGRTKIMEPTVYGSYDGPQEDDIRGAQFLYGDPLENDATPATATPLSLTDQGGGTTAVTLNGIALESGADSDFHSFTVPAGMLITATLTPLGTTYPIGPDEGPFSTLDAAAVLDLALSIGVQSGEDFLSIGTASASPAGAPEILYASSDTDGTHLTRVHSVSTGVDDAQRYTLTITVSPPWGSHGLVFTGP